MKILYVKNNSERAKEFQLKTIIYEENSQKYVKKQALCKEAIPHLKKMKESYEKLSASIINPNIKLAKIINETEDSLTFEFIEGISLEKTFNEAKKRGKQETDKVINDYMALLKKGFKTTQFDSSTMVTDAYIDIFGDLDYSKLDGKVCFESISNIDLIFSNIIFNNNDIYLIDYEWVFDLPICIDFIKYRALPSQNTYYKKLENNFLNHIVIGKYGFFQLQNNYLKPRLTVEQQLQQKEELIQQKEEQIQEKEEEVHHLLELVQSLRLKNRLKRMIPKKAREILHISKHTLKHPVKLFKTMDRQYANKLIKHIKEGNFSYILERMGHYINQDPSNIRLDLMTKYNTEEVLTFSPSSTPLVSIIIPVYNQFDFTHRCLRSILQFTNNIDYEIIIADDVSSDRTQDIHKYIKNIKIIRNEKNLGFLLNCNNATKEVKGDYIVFLNNDTNVQENWLSTLLETMKNDSAIGMVGSKLVYPDGRLQEAGGIIWDDASGWNYGRLDNPEKPEYTYLKEVDYISGAAIMIKTELWKEIGAFDERYVPAYYEDSDLAFEVRKHGYKVVMQPQSVVVHFEGISNGTDTSSGMKKYQIINHKKFYEKWKDILEKEHFPNAQNVFLARDRSRKKPHVLFVDHYLPHYDQDAGSKAALQYLQILTNAGMQVHFIGDNFWHYPGTPYLETLTQMGIEVLHGHKYAEQWKEWIKENGKYLEYVILSRPHISIKYIDIIREFSSAKIIYFGHDLHFLREEREYKIKKDKTYLKSSQYWKKLELELIEKSDVSYYFSNIEQSVIKTYNNDLKVDVVPLYIYNNFKGINYIAKERKDIMFVGGFKHPANTDAIIWFVNEIWSMVHQKLPGVHFYIIGSTPPSKVLDMANEHITVTGFISDEALEAYYKKCKLVVAPLRFGAGVKGKIIDAMYNALPLVTTSIGAEGIQNASAFMKIADDTETFIDTIISLYNDNRELENLSKASLKHCKMYFSEHYAKQQMANIITEFKE